MLHSRSLPDQPRASIKILYVVAEAFPLVKTGGLGDVGGALPPALARLGADVRMVMPAYAPILKILKNLKPGPELGPLLGYSARLLEGTLPGSEIPLWLVDCPPLYGRGDNIYQDPSGEDWPDNHLRFGLLCRAAALIAVAGQLSGWRPDVVHANDWHTGLVPYYMKTWGGDAPPCVFTIHNMAYQGVFERQSLAELAVAADTIVPAGLEYWGKISFLKGGLVFADRVTTVSPTYAREVRRQPMGEGMEGVLRARRDDLVGIVNGIDDGIWNPAEDALIPRSYDATTLSDKDENKKALAALDLAISVDRPVIGIVSRLVEQKGIDVVLNALPAILRTGAQLVILGAGDSALENSILAAAAAHRGNVAARIGYNEPLAHRIIAGADMILMPSRFEPCGLTQLYGQRYGTLPIVHKVGGLADTVHDLQDGFTFTDLTATGVAQAVSRATAVYREPKTWRQMQQRAMAKPMGWDACARHYTGLYDDLIATGVKRHHGTSHRAHP